MFVEKAHDLSEKSRTEDVLTFDDTHFRDFLLSDKTLEGLTASGFRKPSPIQKKAIPLGKCGFDLIVQAKSGTGKTCVFTVIALETVKTEVEKLQVLILSPTREISVQIKDVISAIGRKFEKLKVNAFIGGIPLENDKKNLQECHIAVGAPGRVKHLISMGQMKVDAVRLLVLDEADKLVQENFRKEISFIYLKLPEVKQVIAASATFPPELEDFVTRYMVSPIKISAGNDTFLIGLRQFISIVPSHLSVFVQMKNKVAELFRILSTVPFKQCLVFSNYQSRAESICNELNKSGWPAAYISGSQNQSVRLEAMSSLKEFRCRVLLSTDLTSRGIDAENVNLIINLDLPYDGPTYMHRIGRAGRYGSRGLAITIVQSGLELEQFRKMLHDIGGGNFRVSLFPEERLERDIWNTKDEDFESISSLEGEYKYMKTTSKKSEMKEENPTNHVKDVKERIREEKKIKAVEELSKFLLRLPRPGSIPDKYEIARLIEFYSKRNLASNHRRNGRCNPRRNHTTPDEQSDNVCHGCNNNLVSALLYLEEDCERNVKEALRQKRMEALVDAENNKVSEGPDEGNIERNDGEVVKNGGKKVEEERIEEKGEEEERIEEKGEEEERIEEKGEEEERIEEKGEEERIEEKGEEEERIEEKGEEEERIEEKGEEERIEEKGEEERIEEKGEEERIEEKGEEERIEEKVEEERIEEKGEEEEKTEEKGEEEDEEEEQYDSESDSCESDNSEQEYDHSSYFIRQWYSMWYSQLYTVRKYINYMKYSHYWNEILNNK